jgi:pantoate--beta-alanine ligase
MISVTTSRDLARVMAPGGRRCVFVPTMGALHAGHAALVQRGAAIASGRGLADGCVVSIFVNPTQFNDASDYDKYPKTLEADLALCERAGAAIVYAPGATDVYPEGETIATPPLPDVATRPKLEDAHRPGHFAGVCQVVKRLFDLVRPQVAVFGEKDWQQLQVVRAMTRALRYPIAIESHETVREQGGLAMSSRNARLSPEDRAKALAISHALCESWSARSPRDAEAIMRRELEHQELEVEYAVVRDAETLLEPRRGQPMRTLIAARVGGVRLIDNVEWRGA